MRNESDDGVIHSTKFASCLVVREQLSACWSRPCHLPESTAVAWPEQDFCNQPTAVCGPLSDRRPESSASAGLGRSEGPRRAKRGCEVG